MSHFLRDASYPFGFDAPTISVELKISLQKEQRDKKIRASRLPDISVTDLAKRLGVSRKAVSAIINEHKSLTPEMALRLSKAFPNSTPESWLNLQRNYDLWQTSHGTFAWKLVQPINFIDARQ